MPADLAPIHLFPYRKRTGAGSILLWMFLAVFMTREIARAFTQSSSTLNTILLVVCSLVTVFVLVLHFCKPDQPPTFYVSETRAGFGNPHRDPSAVPFTSVTECVETPSSLQLVHESISVPLGIELRRHDFAIEDWETLTALLIEKVRSQAPRARVKTLLDPPEGP